MARPKKNNAEYFPHLTTMRNHRKVKAIRNKFGAVLGYAFWSMFLEYLTELDGNEFEFSQMECEMFAAELGVSASEIPPLINYCIEIELLFKTDTNFIYSDSLNEALKPVYEKRGRERNKSKTRQRHENGVFTSDNTTSHGVSAAEIPQSKVKKSKVNKNISVDSDSFEVFWNLYDKREGKKECLKKWSKLSFPDIEKILAHVPNYVKSTPNPQYRKNPLTYLNGEHWYDEVIVEKNIESGQQSKQHIPTVSEFDFDSLTAQRLAAIQQAKPIQA